jgi:hypothetical protein
MTLRERILAVYSGRTPDVVPCMLDLSHWFYHRHRLPWDLSIAYEQPEYELIDYHRKMGVGFYLPNLASIYSVHYPDDVKASVAKRRNGTEIVWSFETPLGAISRVRRWEEGNYAWGIAEWGVKTEQDLRILAYALGNRTYTPRWDRYRAWDECVGDAGVAYACFGYSAMGQLLNLWMGVEQTMYAICDWPKTVREVVDQINLNNLACIDVLATCPGRIVIMGDNFSSDIQPPHFFSEWSRQFYVEAIRRLHAAGKCVAVHIDGRLRGALRMIRDAGADCSDATTPAPMGDLTPIECREEAGLDFILSGGVPPNLWLPDVAVEAFKKAVIHWLELRRLSPRLIAAAGDQVPPGAAENRIEIMRNLVERHGRY